MKTEIIQNKNILPDEYVHKPYFPLSYFTGFLKFLRQNRGRIKIITYDDLAWNDDEDHSPEAYREEFRRWTGELSEGKRDPDMIYLLLQHDIDAKPDRARLLLEHELKHDISSNIMIFNKRINRMHLEKAGQIELTQYYLDHQLLEQLENQHGFVIGYHSNAMERARYNKNTAEEIFYQDVLELRNRYRINYYSPHGGVPGPDGLNNRDVVPPAELLNPPRWVHNGQSPSFNGYYSDGGINSTRIDPRDRDLRDFVRTWKPGSRYRVLIHPQYYGHEVESSPRLKNTSWYDEVLAMSRDNKNENIWENVQVPD